MNCKYTYLKNRYDFENEMPFDYEEFDKYIEKYPSVYPCILEFEVYDLHSPDGPVIHIEIIEDTSDFVYQNGNLYKLDKSDFICQNGCLYKKC